jgi:hypothetical protein
MLWTASDEENLSKSQMYRWFSIFRDKFLRKSEAVDEMSRACWSFFFSVIGLCILSLPPQTKLLIGSIVQMSYCIYKKMSAKKSKMYGEMATVWFILTMCPFTKPLLSEGPWSRTKNKMGVVPIPFLSRPRSLWLSFPRLILNLKGKRFNNVLQVQQNSHLVDSSTIIEKFKTYFQWCLTPSLMGTWCKIR